MILYVLFGPLLVVPVASQTIDPVLSSILSEVGSIYSSVTSALGNVDGSTSAVTTTATDATSSTDSAQTTSSSLQLPSTTTASALTGLSSLSAAATTVATSQDVPSTDSAVSTAPAASSNTFSISIITTSSSAASSSATAASSSPAAASSSNGGFSHDRVAAIATGSILGALVLGLIILLVLILCRRRRRQSPSREDSLLQHEGVAAAVPSRQRGSQIWFGTRNRHNGNGNLPGRPLMSENSPRYGIHSPGPRVISGLAPPEQSGPGHDGEYDDSAALGSQRRNSLLNGRKNEGSPRGVLSGVGATAASTVRSSRDRHRYSLLEEEGEPSQQDVRRTPDLLRSSAGPHKRKGSVFSDDFMAPRQDPLASHPATAADLAVAQSISNNQPKQPPEDLHEASGSPVRQSNNPRGYLEVPMETGNGDSDSGSSLSREGFASAIAGLGMETFDNRAEQPIYHRGPEEKPKIVRGGSDPAELSGAPTAAALGPLDYPARSSASLPIARPYPTRLEIPQILHPGRTRSRRARFSDAGGVSPPTTSWLDLRDAAPRQSIISPISPERGANRGYSYSPPRGNHTGFDSFIDQAPRSAPMTTSYPIPPLMSSTSVPGLGKERESQNIRGSLVGNRDSAIQQRQYLPPIYASEESPQTYRQPRPDSPAIIRRKPVSGSFDPIPRKPVPATLQIPTSKYNSSIPRQVPSSTIQTYSTIPQSTHEYHRLVTQDREQDTPGVGSGTIRRVRNNGKGKEKDPIYEPQASQHITNWWDDDDDSTPKPPANNSRGMSSEYSRMYGGQWISPPRDERRSGQRQSQRQSYVSPQYTDAAHSDVSKFHFGWEGQDASYNQ